MSPADIANGAEFRVGLARRLAEVGLIPPEQPYPRVATLPGTPGDRTGEDRKAA